MIFNCEHCGSKIENISYTIEDNEKELIKRISRDTQEFILSKAETYGN